MKQKNGRDETHEVNELKEQLKEALHEDDPINASRAAPELFQLTRPFSVPENSARSGGHQSGGTVLCKIGIFIVTLAMIALPITAQQQEQYGELAEPLLRATELFDLSVVDQQGEEIGSVEDIILTSDGRVSHFVAEIDGIQNQESGQYLIPADLVSLQDDQLRLRNLQQLNRVDEQMQLDSNYLPVSGLMEFEVMGTSGDSIGNIEDVVINTRQNSVVYTVLGTGGILGIGQDLFAVPFEEMQIDPDQEQILLDVTEDQLEMAGGFNQENWPESAEEEWAQPRMGEVEREAEEEGSILGAEEGTRMGQGPRMPEQPEPPGQPMEPVEPVQP